MKVATPIEEKSTVPKPPLETKLLNPLPKVPQSLEITSWLHLLGIPHKVYIPHIPPQGLHPSTPTERGFTSFIPCSRERVSKEVYTYPLRQGSTSPIPCSKVIYNPPPPTAWGEVLPPAACGPQVFSLLSSGARGDQHRAP